MKFLAYLFLITFLISTNTFAQFRNTTWGMTEEEVITKENKAIYDDRYNQQKSLNYKTTLSTYEISLRYYIEDNKLYKGEYYLNKKNMTLPQYQSAYDHFKNLLITKYSKNNFELMERLEITEEGSVVRKIILRQTDWDTNDSHISLRLMKYWSEGIVMFYGIHISYESVQAWETRKESELKSRKDVLKDF